MALQGTSFSQLYTFRQQTKKDNKKDKLQQSNIVKNKKQHNIYSQSYSIMEAFNPQFQLKTLYKKENNNLNINSNKQLKQLGNDSLLEAQRKFDNGKLQQMMNSSNVNGQKVNDFYQYDNKSAHLKRSSSSDQYQIQNQKNNQIQKHQNILKKNMNLFSPSPKITQQKFIHTRNILNNSSIGGSNSQIKAKSDLSPPQASYQMGKLNKFYNYINSDAIKYKQYHGFNIISGIPGYYG